jgi:hypothetical protein
MANRRHASRVCRFGLPEGKLGLVRRLVAVVAFRAAEGVTGAAALAVVGVLAAVALVHRLAAIPPAERAGSPAHAVPPDFNVVRVAHAVDDPLERERHF